MSHQPVIPPGGEAVHRGEQKIVKTKIQSLGVLVAWLAAVDSACAQVVTASLSFTFPLQQPGYFGSAVAAQGADKVIVGDFNLSGAPGAAYLFHTNGSLITTFTNPVPTIWDDFGSSVAAVGADKVLIGAPRDDTGGGAPAFDSGAAYLFSTNGTLMTTYTNPTPGQSDLFGSVITAVGPDKVLIGKTRWLGFQCRTFVPHHAALT